MKNSTMLLFLFVYLLTGCAADITKPDQKSCGESGNYCATEHPGSADDQSPRGREICEMKDNVCQCFCQPTVTH